MTRASAAVKKLGIGLRRGASRFRHGLFPRLSPRNRLLAYLAILGPGMIAANAGNDASGIATYSTVGAKYGYNLLWVFLPMLVSLLLVQEMCVRMGVVTGKGLADLIREQFGVRQTVFVMMALLVANIGVIISEFVGIAQAAELFGVSRYLAVPAGRGCYLVAGGPGHAKTGRAGFPGNVAGISQLYCFRFFGKTRLGRSFRGNVQASHQFFRRVSLYRNGADRYHDHTFYAGVRAVFGGGKRNGQGRLQAGARRCSGRERSLP